MGEGKDKFGYFEIIHLILINFTVLQLGFTLLLEGNNDQGDEDIHEEEWKHDEVDHIEYGHFQTKIIYRPPTFVCCRHGML